MGKIAGIPCIECDYRFTDDTPAGRNRCPNCYTEYRLVIDTSLGIKELVPYTPLSSVSHSKTPEVVMGKIKDDALKAEAVYLQSFLPKDDECFFCHQELTFLSTIHGLIRNGRVMVEKNSTDVVRNKDGSSEVFHNSNMVPLPENIAVKTKKVVSCPNCIDKLYKVFPPEKNMVEDRWSKKTGARKQHYTRKVEAGSGWEAKADGESFYREPDKVISRKVRVV